MKTRLQLPFNMLKVMGTPADSKSEQQTQTKQSSALYYKKIIVIRINYHGLYHRFIRNNRKSKKRQLYEP